ncbi:MAG: type II secretion system F family protein [Opitutaceae bacterium]|nr:type II secretion system F family protein [Cephaloticoccus sp.]MCP5529560.1 type II secretion system F family protein [Opitutaceae bacterium]
MPEFAYTARDAQGKSVRDTVNAASRREALRLLAARGLQPVSLNERTTAKTAATPSHAPTSGSPASTKATPRADDLLPFLQSLSELTSSGMSPGEAVRLLANRIKEARLRTLCVIIWDGLKEGLTLSQTMETVPVVFDPQTVNLVRAGEATGSLNEVLLRLIEHHTTRRELKQKLITAMAYPVAVTVMAFGVVMFFVFFLMPRLQGLLNSLGGKLPISTQLLVSGSEMLVRYGIIIIPAVALTVLLVWRWHKTEAGRVTIDGWLVQIPLVRGWVIDTGVLAFVQTLAVLLENGINTVEALRLTERTVPNRTMCAALKEATEQVIEGESLSAALGRTAYFPDLVLDRLAVGENTGQLAPCLRDLAKHYSNRHTVRLQRMVGVVTQAVLVGVFVFVGFLAYAIVAAVLRVSSSFQF